jgi:urease accessory protein
MRELLLLQLADSAFPTGGFSHSLGLEAARSHGLVSDAAKVERFLWDSLRQCAHGALPFIGAMFGAASKDGPEIAFRGVDAHADAFLTNPTANQASRVQARSLRAAAEHVFCIVLPDGLRHQAPTFGAVALGLGLPLTDARRVFLFQHLRGIASAAVRLGLLGPLEAQAMHRDLSPRAEALLLQTAHFGLDDLAQTHPLAEVCASRHDTLYSRLFMS